MINKGITPDIFSYNPIITSALLSNNLDRAQYFLEKMKSQGVAPDNVTYLNFLKYKAKVNDVDGMLEILREIKKSGVAPTTLTHTTILLAMSKVKSTEECLNFLENEIRPTGTQPDIGLYNIIISCAVREKEWDKIPALLELMANDGIAPNTATYNLLIRRAGGLGDLNECTALMGKMVELGIDHDGETYDAVVSAMVAHGNIDGAFAAIKDMKQYNLEMDPFLYDKLIEGCSKANRALDCRKLLSECQRSNHKPYRKSYFNTLTALVQSVLAPVPSTTQPNGLGKRAWNQANNLHGHILDTIKEMLDSKILFSYSTLQDIEATFLKHANANDKLQLYRVLSKEGVKLLGPFMGTLVGDLAKAGQQEELAEVMHYCRKHNIKLPPSAGQQEAVVQS